MASGIPPVSSVPDQGVEAVAPFVDPALLSSSGVRMTEPLVWLASLDVHMARLHVSVDTTMSALGALTTVTDGASASSSPVFTPID